MTHDEYLDEPVEVVDWAIAFDNMEGKMQQDAMDRNRPKGR